MPLRAAGCWTGQPLGLAQQGSPPALFASQAAVFFCLTQTPVGLKEPHTHTRSPPSVAARHPLTLLRLPPFLCLLRHTPGNLCLSRVAFGSSPQLSDFLWSLGGKGGGRRAGGGGEAGRRWLLLLQALARAEEGQSPVCSEGAGRQKAQSTNPGDKVLHTVSNAAGWGASVCVCGGEGCLGKELPSHACQQQALQDPPGSAGCTSRFWGITGHSRSGGSWEVLEDSLGGGETWP